MNPNEPEIETLLRHAPNPQPPVGLRNQLLPQPHPAPASRSGFALPQAWWMRWWPALAAGCVTLVCLGVLAMQQREIAQLQHTLEKLQAPQGPAPDVDPTPSPGAEIAEPAINNGPDDIRRLRTAVQELTPEVANLEALQRENQALRQQSATELANTEEFQALAEARERARAIMCVNNLKQLGLAARIWATDHNDVYPPSLVAMTKEMGSPKILVCPSDTGRQPASDWSVFTAANVSYEYLAASAPDTEPNRVMFRCPAHGSVTLCDGSVQRLGKDHPELLVNRGGILYLADQPTPAATPPAATVPSGTVNMSPEMMQRYGLKPAAEPPTPPAQSNP